MRLVTVLRSRGQLTIPAEIKKAARLEEGDAIEVEMTSEGILLRPKKMIDSTQAWFWTPEWQAGEREAEEDIRLGRSKVFVSGEDFIKDLKSRMKTRPAKRAGSSRSKRRG